MKFLHYLAQDQTINTNALPNPAANEAALSTILQIVFAFAGSIALLIVVIGGLRYVLAHGDPNSVSQAKKTILYAIVGLLVCLASYGIVIFVVKGVA